MHHRLIGTLVVAVVATAAIGYSTARQAPAVADPLQFDRELGKLLSAADELADACQRNWRACSNRAEALAAEKNHLARWDQLRKQQIAVGIPRDDSAAVDLYTSVSQLLQLGRAREESCLKQIEQTESDTQFTSAKQRLRDPQERRWQRTRQRAAQARKAFQTVHDLATATR